MTTVGKLKALYEQYFLVEGGNIIYFNFPSSERAVKISKFKKTAYNNDELIEFLNQGDVKLYLRSSGVKYSKVANGI